MTRTAEPVADTVLSNAVPPATPAGAPDDAAPDAASGAPAAPAAGHAHVNTSFRTLGLQTLLFGIGMVFARAVSFVMLPVYTRHLTPADYGVLQLLDMTLEIAALLLTAGATAGLQRFYFKTDDPRERTAVVSTAYALEIALGVVGTALILALATPIWRYGLRGAGSETLVRIAAFNFSLPILTLVPTTLLQMRQRAGLVLALSVSRLALQVTGNVIFLVVLGWGVRGILTSTLIVNVVFGIAYAAWLLRQTGVHVNWRIMRDLRRFGLPYQAAFAGSFIMTFGDRFFLQAYQGVSEVGRYGLAYQFGFLLAGLAFQPFLNAWTPHRHALARQPREERDPKYARGFFFLNLVMITVGVGISLLVRPTLHLMTTPEYFAAARYVPVILAAYVMQSWAYTVNFALEVSERTRYVTLGTWVGVVATLVAYATLIPRYGAMGAATATLLGFGARFVATYAWAQRVWPIAYDWPRVARICASAVIVVVAELVLAPAGWAEQIATAAALLGVYAALVWLTALTTEDRARVAAVVRAPSRARQLLAG